MTGHTNIKRAIQSVAGSTAALLAPVYRGLRRSTVSVLVYHRVAELGFVDPSADDWNVSPKRFEAQIAALAGSVDFAALHDLPARLAHPGHSKKPLVCLTFDDGYASFHANVLPILQRYQAPATVFVVTSQIGQTEPLVFDRWAQRNRHRTPPAAWRPMNWAELDACAESGLVTIGAHSHRHLKGRESNDAQLVEEVQRSCELLRARFGKNQIRAYSYPYGSTRLGYVPPAYVSAVKRWGFELAVTTDLGLVRQGCDWYRLPRIEGLGVDSPGALRAKASGCLAPLYLTDRLRTARRAL